MIKRQKVYASCLLGSSGADRDRTGDPLVANQVLSQLSYRPFLPATSTSASVWHYWLLVIGYVYW